MFYGNEDLDSWFMALFEERWEDADAEERTTLRATLKGQRSIRDWCGEQIDEMAEIQNQMFIGAILNSCDYEFILRELREWVDAQ